MNIEVFGLSDVGMRRERNEDSCLVSKELGLFVVADGMGGHVGGEFASKLAVKTIEDVIKEIFHKGETSILEQNGLGAEDFSAHLRCAIQKASLEIYKEAKRQPALKGMGTTSVALLARNDNIYIANVGDSRGYLIRNGRIFQLTEDHSLVGEQLRAGVISEFTAKGHKLRNIITRSVGFQKEVEIDVLVKVPRENDRYLLCSDGLTNMVDDGEILDVVTDCGLEEACHVLVDMANTRGGDDNITVIIARVTDAPIHAEPDEEDESTIGI